MGSKNHANNETDLTNMKVDVCVVAFYPHYSFERARADEEHACTCTCSECQAYVCSKGKRGHIYPLRLVYPKDLDFRLELDKRAWQNQHL